MAKNNPQKVHSVYLQAQKSAYSGPIPPPEALAKYENTLPGAAERIMRMAEKEQAHRHQITQEKIHRENRGQIIGASLILILIIAAIILALINQILLSTIIFSTLILGIGCIFVLNRKPSKE